MIAGDLMNFHLSRQENGPNNDERCWSHWKLRILAESRQQQREHYTIIQRSRKGRQLRRPLVALSADNNLLTRRPVGLLELCSFLPDGTHFVPGKQTLHFDVCNGTG